MHQFKNLTLSYEKLKKEIEFLTTESIKRNSEYNTISTNLKQIKSEFEIVEKELNEYKYKHLADLRNDKKAFITNLNKKELELNKKELELNKKEKRNEACYSEIQKEMSILHKNQKKVERKEKINIIDSENNKNKAQSLKIKQQIIQNQKETANQTEKESIHILEKAQDELKKANQIREKAEKDTKLQFNKLQSQIKLLEDREARLIQKEQKIQSEMNTLISAKKHLGK